MHRARRLQGGGDRRLLPAAWRWGCGDQNRDRGCGGLLGTRQEPAGCMERHAGRTVAEGWRADGWDAERLHRERKGHPEKVRLPRKFRGEATMTLRWIAENLSMGSWTYVSRSEERRVG